MEFLNGESYGSTPLSETGFIFQEELLLHFSLMMRRMKCENFKMGYEVMDFPKFDDVVFQFELRGVTFLILLQAKFVLKKTRKIDRDQLLDEKAKFHLKQYFAEMVKSRKDIPEGIIPKFILLTTLSMKRDGIDVSEEHNYGLKDLFGGMMENGAEVLRFGPGFTKDIKDIVGKLGELEDAETAASQIRDDFVFVGKSPNIEELMDINHQMLKMDFNVTNYDPFFKNIRTEISKAIACNTKTKKRTVLTEKTFENILLNAVLSVDLPVISETFHSEFSVFIDFDVDFLHSFEDKSDGRKVFDVDYHHAKLFAFKIYLSVKRKESNTILLPLGKLHDQHRTALKFYKDNLVILADDTQDLACIPDKRNFYVIKEINNDLLATNSKPPQIIGRYTAFKALLDDKDLTLTILPQEREPLRFFYELTKEARLKFMKESTIILQDHLINIEKIGENDSKEYETLMIILFREIFNGKNVEIGRELPKNKIPEPYIARKFQYRAYKEKIPDDKLLSTFRLCFVKGDPGMGKSCTLQKIADISKKAKKEIWFEYIDLKRLSRAFSEKASSENLDFTKDEARDFLMENIIDFGENPVISRKFFEYYLTSENRIILIFDGFDEIMPTYEQVVVNLVRKLSSYKIRIYITGRLHCESILNQLPNCEHVEILPYDTDDRENFLDTYYLSKLTTATALVTRKLVIETNKIIESQDDNARNPFNRPLYQKILADIIIHDHRNSFEEPKQVYKYDSTYLIEYFERLNILWLYDRFFQLTFDVFYEKEGIDPASAYAIAKKNQEMQNIRLIHTYLALKALKYDHLFDDILEKSRKVLGLKLTEGKLLYKFDLSYVINQVDILGRGFISRDDYGKFHFTHRTFAEYFCAGFFLAELEENSNITVLELIIDQERYGTDKIGEFMWEMIITKIKEKKPLKIAKTDYSDHNSLLLEFLCKLVLYAWQRNDLTEFSEVLEFFWKLFSYGSYQKIDYKKIALIYSANLNRFLNRHQDRRLKRIKCIYELRREKNCKLCREFSFKSEIEILKLLLDSSSSEFFEKNYSDIEKNCPSKKDLSQLFFSLMLDEGVKLNEGNFEKQIDILVVFLRIKLAYFENPSVELCEDFQTVLNHKHPTNFQPLYFVSIHKLDLPDILKTTSRLVLQQNKLFEFFSHFDCLLDQRFSNKLEKVKIVIQNYYAMFESTETLFNRLESGSILHHFWINNHENIFELFLRLFSKDQVFELTESPNFRGRSLLDFYHSEPDASMINSYLMYVSTNFGADELSKFFSNYNTTGNIEKLILKDVNLLNTLTIEMDRKDWLYIEKNVERLCESVLNWEAENKRKIGFLHILAKMDIKTTIVDIIFSFFEGKKILSDSHDNPSNKIDISEEYFKESGNILVEKLFERDENGNNPLQISILEGNTGFYDAIAKYHKNNLIKMMQNVNYENENALHCFGNSRYNWFPVEPGFLRESKVDIENKDEEQLCQMITEQDIYGRTPIHTKWGFNILRHSQNLIMSSHLKSLFMLKDRKDNNIFHCLSMNNNNYGRDEYDYMFTELKHLFSFYEIIKEALQSKNYYNETPFDICERRKLTDLLYHYSFFLENESLGIIQIYRG